MNELDQVQRGKAILIRHQIELSAELESLLTGIGQREDPIAAVQRIAQIDAEFEVTKRVLKTVTIQIREIRKQQQHREQHELIRKQRKLETV